MLETWKDYCPYCGERIELLIDPGLSGQTYTEDCEVCCRPMCVTIANGSEALGADSWAQPFGEPALPETGSVQVQLRREDEV